MPLFDSILVFENYPLDTSVKERSNTLDVRDLIPSSASPSST